MKQDALQGAEKYSKAHRRRTRRYRIVSALACFVVFCTVYALILPAITLERAMCEIPEHTHTEACYTQITSVTRIEPVCTAESLRLHRHVEACYDSEGNLTCGYADFVVHHHDASCYDENGKLWCPLKEIRTHQHTESCYALPEAGAAEAHIHTDECYAVERGELICTEAAEPAHAHTDDCYTETSALVCEEEHEHTESCYETTRELTCGYTEEPAHQHTDSCYEQIRTLICELSTEPAEEAEPAEPELICNKTEVILHEHTADCYGNGKLICGKIQVLAHQHTDACFGAAEVPVDTEALTCTLPEDENHTHGPLCYGTWELTCTLEEHTHSEECTGPEKTTYCGLVAHTHGEACRDQNGELVCALEEHTHSLACYSDSEADVETAEIWEQTLADVTRTGDWRQDVLAVARTQLGYAESTKNYAVWEDGTRHGYTRYGEWYGSPYADWCAMFASFCIRYAGVEDMPLSSVCRSWIEELEALERYRPAQGEEPYSPEVGDLIFYDWEGDGQSDHVGIVAELIPATEDEPAQLAAIEGNAGNRVKTVTYALDDPEILGYGLLPEQVFLCGKTGHVHTDRCGSDCPLEEHIHTEQCVPPAGGKALTFEGEDYIVLVQYGPDAALPEGVALEVSEIPWDSEEYERYLERASAELETAGRAEPVVFARFFDIRFLLDGQKVEPSAPVSVSVIYADGEGLESADYLAVHFTEDAVELLEAEATRNEDGSVRVSHTQSGFSVVGDVATCAGEDSASTFANASTAGLDHTVTFLVKIRENWVNVGSCTYDTSAVGNRNASVSDDVLHQYLDNYGYAAESNPTGALQCSYDDIYTIYYAQNGSATNFALDIPSANITEKAYLQLWTANQSPAQTFRIWRVVDSYYFITPLANSGLHVNLQNGATANGTRLWLHSALDEASWWGIRNNNDGTVSFYSQKKTNAYIDVTGNNQSDGTVIELYENGSAIYWKPEKKYVAQDVVADSGRVGLTAESNGNIVCFYTPSTPLNDPNAIYTAEELSRLGTSGSYYLGCDITVAQVNGSAADIDNGVSTTLDLRGHTIHYNVPEAQSECSLVYLHGTGSLTITDSGQGQAVETTEVVTDLPLYGNLASYDGSTETLVYYVTESRPNGDGTTTETLVKHTVDLTHVGAMESDTAPYHLIFVANDAVLNIQGGRYTNPNGKRAITAYDNSSVNISGGYLCGSANYGNGIVGGAVHVNSTGALNISGGVIAANRADKAGGVYKNGGTFTMTGGVISGNQVPADASNGEDCRGGGVQIDNAATTISGGYITNNRLDYKCDAVGTGCHFGGGIAIYSGTTTVSDNSYITGNYSAEAGGGIGFSGEQFIMTGGTVAANVAQTAEGGGIRIQSSEQTSLISGGYVTNNRTNSMHDWGGGGIFLVQGNSLQILNAVFQQNTADGFGGGVGGCSTGQIMAVDNTVGGVAIFDNHANGRTMSGSDGVANAKQDDLIARSNEVFMTNGYNDFFCALNSAVAGTMLGGGAENWHGSCDYQKIDIGKDQIAAANKMMGLNASPTDADKQTAIRQGTLFVSGNFSQTHGGGIMSNGILILGQAKDITLSPGLEIEVYKAFKDANGNELDQQPGQFRFLLQDSNHKPIATVTNHDNGMVLAEQDYTQAGTYTYYLTEQPGSNPLITYDATEYQITVTVGTETKTLNLSANQSMTITYYVVTDIQVSLSSGTGTAETETGDVGSTFHRATVVIGKDNGAAFTNTMNEKPLYFRITKLNGHTNEPLQFVEFVLMDENGKVVTNGKTDQAGQVSLQIEKGKSYRLYETPYKDFMPAGPWILEADTEGNVKIYDTTTGEDGSISKSGEGTACTKEEKDVAVYFDHTILNLIAGCELPNTGGAGVLPYTLGGILLLTGAAFLLMYIHFRRRKEDLTSS